MKKCKIKICKIYFYTLLFLGLFSIFLIPYYNHKSNESTHNSNSINIDSDLLIVSGIYNPINLQNNKALDDFCSSLGTDGLSWETAHRIENFTIDGGIAGYCIWLHNTNRYLIIRNCTLKNVGGSSGGACYFDNSSNIWVKNCTFDNNKYGVKASTDTFDTEKNLIIDNCTFLKSYNSIDITYYNNTEIINNFINGSTCGAINLARVSQSRVSNNKISNCQFGIVLVYNVYKCYNNIMSYNNLTNINGYEFKFYDTYNTTLKHNKMEKGLEFYDANLDSMKSYNISISNTVRGRPIYYYVNKQHLTLENFTNSGQIFLINCSKSRISNLSFNNSRYPILLHSCANNTILNSNFSYNYECGIRLYYSTNTTIYNCSFFENSGHGIKIESGLHNNITKNSIQSNANDGIYLYYANNNSISYNNITHNSNGIYIRASDNNNIWNNNCSFNQRGIFIYDYSANNTIWLNYLCNNSAQQALDNNDVAWYGNNYWDNGTVGNYWEDYTKKYPSAHSDGFVWDTPYKVDGSANSYDHFPLVLEIPLTISRPKDISFMFGTKGNNITWVIVDNRMMNPNYTIYIDQVKNITKSWSSGQNITICVDILNIGTHNVTIIAFNGLRDYVIDQVNITVLSQSQTTPVSVSNNGDGGGKDNSGKKASISFGYYYLLFGLISVLLLSIVVKSKSKSFRFR